MCRPVNTRPDTNCAVCAAIHWAEVAMASESGPSLSSRGPLCSPRQDGHHSRCPQLRLVEERPEATRSPRLPVWEYATTVLCVRVQRNAARHSRTPRA